MHFVVIGKDPAGGAPRRAQRPAHLEFVENRQHLIVYAGPLIEDGGMVGSIFVFDVPDRTAIDDYMAEDPYFTPGIFESVEVYESRWMVPEREPGFLRAEAERARQAG
jgi:uncharacterized protein YciI